MTARVVVACWGGTRHLSTGTEDTYQYADCEDTQQYEDGEDCVVVGASDLAEACWGGTRRRSRGTCARRRARCQRYRWPTTSSPRWCHHTCILVLVQYILVLVQQHIQYVVVYLEGRCQRDRWPTTSSPRCGVSTHIHCYTNTILFSKHINQHTYILVY